MEKTLKVIGFQEVGEVTKVVYGVFDKDGNKMSGGTWDAPKGTTTDEALLEFAKGTIAPGEETIMDAVVELDQAKADEFLAEQAKAAGTDGTQPIQA